MEHLVVDLFLMGLLIFTEIRNYLERKSLLDRLMARDLPELVTYETERRKVRIPDKMPKEVGIRL